MTNETETAVRNAHNAIVNLQYMTAYEAIAYLDELLGPFAVRAVVDDVEAYAAIVKDARNWSGK